MTHQNWKIRKLAYQEIGQSFLNFKEEYDPEQPNPFEFFSGWLKRMMTDNSTSA